MGPWDPTSIPASFATDIAHMGDIAYPFIMLYKPFKKHVKINHIPKLAKPFRSFIMSGHQTL